MAETLSPEMSMTHAHLVSRAVRWLRNTKGCPVITTKAILIGTEQPDALGWKGNGFSILVECKASRGDFFRDTKKFFRQSPDRGMGNERYYLTPPGLVRVDEVPDRWSLLECYPACIKVKRQWVSLPEKNRAEEIIHLVAHIVRGGEWFSVALEEGCVPDAGI